MCRLFLCPVVLFTLVSFSNETESISTTLESRSPPPSAFNASSSVISPISPVNVTATSTASSTNSINNETYATALRSAAPDSAILTTTFRRQSTMTASIQSDVMRIEQPKKRNHDIMHVYGTVEFSRDIYINMRIHESECFSARTESSYVIYLGALSFESEFLSWYPIRQDQRTSYDNETGISEFQIVVDEKTFLEDPEECFSKGGDPCVPRADVIYIQYHNEPEDSWSISQIEVEIQFRLWPGGENWHVFKYEHSVLMPCESWMDEAAFYQIGPRIGLFLKLTDVPVPGKWVRDWI